MTDVELSDEEYDAWLGLLDLDEARLEVDRQEEAALTEALRAECTEELCRELQKARAAFDKTPKDFADWVNYAAARQLAYAEFARLTEREDDEESP